MLSLNQAIEIKESILAYLKATFTFQDKEVDKAFYNFINDPTEGMFKGPYLSLKLPFVKASLKEQKSIPLTIKPNWLPYDHQVKSWHRLSTANQAPEPTIITTGTGSGKTESFMYPILDYCYRNLSRQGIKVIILYPMNALATDQAKRLAEAINEDDRIKGKVTAGLFIGEGKNAAKYPKAMGPTNIIENRESILASPPDILLTNFKMLDYGLMKSEYNDLWLNNYNDPSLLQFLVLDELHTYDGAQGTDVANLIRRLKLKLNLPENHLCPVGTSATIGSGQDAPRLLSEYASKIYGEKIESDCIITENRINIDDFFFDDNKLDTFKPRIAVLKDVKPLTGEGYDKYIDRQIGFWQVNRGTLAKELSSLKIVKDLVRVVNEGKGVHTFNLIVRNLSSVNKEFREEVPQWDEENQFSPKEHIVLSLFALIAEAKQVDPQNGRKSPFLYTQTQLWIRELSGVLREMSETPKFTWKASENSEERLSLPPWYCRECGASGWLGIKHDNKERFEKDIQDIYSKFFTNHKHIYFANRTSWFSIKDAVDGGYEPDDNYHKFIGNSSLEFYSEKGEERTEITAFRKLNNQQYNEHICPECNTKNTVSIIGTRIATLSSISVSQILATDLDQQDEQGRKVLAFTNSVQDAAHQAGFVEARNYRFTFRSSLQKVINELNKEVSLTELSNEFIKYWKNNADETGTKPLDAYYYRFYPTDYLGKSKPQDYQNSSGKYEQHFVTEFDYRIKWELYSEFGYNSLIGRTLEKTNSSAVAFSPSIISEAWIKVSQWLEDNEPTKTINEDDFKRFLILLLHRVRTRGAISHSYLSKFREKELKLWDLNWMKDSRHFLNKNFGPRTRIPKLLTYKSDSRGILDSTFSKTTNWVHQYFKKSFPLASQHTDLVNEFFENLIVTLNDLGLVNQANTEEKINYALSSDNIFVSSQTKSFTCQTCGHTLHTSQSESDLSLGKCLVYRCHGNYEQDLNIKKENYYQLVYNRSRSPRIYAADHTGLLERKARENLEIDFKTRPNFNSKNAMVATSTLEMGIDIGSLNTAINNSVPPMPSNFLQRVGRAGRSTGSALVVNFAKSQAHDLFYYANPLDMIAGEVNTPGCYIEAKEILRRHFFAFCLDTWSKSNPSSNRIPSLLRFIRIETADLMSADFFMNRILNFVKSNEAQLFDQFKSLYLSEVDIKVFDKLKYELDNESFYEVYKRIFSRLKDEVKEIQKIRKEIDKRIRDLNLGKGDPERVELENEKKNLGGIIRSINKRSTLEHLTNVGVLPNYAFPETGVSLSAKVLGNKAAESNKPPVNKDFEIVRSATQALKEFAPDNHFYSQGFKFLITGLNTFDWSDNANFHKKRFCSNCDHIEIEETSPRGNCPKCGHDSWSASSNVHSFAKLLSVKSFNNQSDASINDSSDDRENVPYNLIQHFNFHSQNSRGAYAMKEIPFGIEFFNEVTITEGNLGRKDAVDPRKVIINDAEAPTHGFVTCKACGKSSSHVKQKINGKDYKFHYGYCKHKDKEYQGMSDEVFEEVFLFREIQTEALKILLPVQELNSDAEIKMFQAGIELGLKKYFQGNPQHIRLSMYREYNHITSKFDKYLVLYDSIPGGTGYLEKLFSISEFNQILKKAYSEIKNCNCQFLNKDGCYRCIYSYSNQYHQEDLSRQQAEKRFYEIIKRSEDWEAQPSGLGNLTNSGNIEESELEERFIRSLKKLSNANKGWSLEEVNDDGVTSYTLQYKDSFKDIMFFIRPQVNLGKTDGIEYYTRSDFLIICTHYEVNGNIVEDRNSIPRIAIYLDGFQFHASKENNRFEDDLKKRQAIANSSSHYSWTLTWEDVEQFDSYVGGAVSKDYRDTLCERLVESKEYDQVRKKLTKSISRDTKSLEGYENNFIRLLEILKSIDDTNRIKLDLSLYSSFFHEKLFTPSYAPDQISEAIEGQSMLRYCMEKKTLDGLVPIKLHSNNSLFKYRLASNIAQGKLVGDYTLINVQDIDKSTWNEFWIIYNLIQFFEINMFIEDSIPEENSIDIGEILELYNKDLQAIVQRLYDKGQIKTEDDEIGLNSLIDQSNDVIAEAELIIHSIKSVYNPYSLDDENEFKNNGYSILSLENIKEIKL